MSIPHGSVKQLERWLEDLPKSVVLPTKTDLEMYYEASADFLFSLTEGAREGQLNRLAKAINLAHPTVVNPQNTFVLGDLWPGRESGMVQIINAATGWGQSFCEGLVYERLHRAHQVLDYIPKDTDTPLLGGVFAIQVFGDPDDPDILPLLMVVPRENTRSWSKILGAIRHPGWYKNRHFADFYRYLAGNISRPTRLERKMLKKVVV